MKGILKRKEKQNGNVILMVLMVATVLILLSAVVSSALVFTTSGNTAVKYKNDYMYAAEGGVEYGVEKFTKEGPFKGIIDPATGTDTGVEVSFLGDSTVTNDRDIYQVRVICNKVGTGKYELVSKVINKNGDLLGKITLPISGRVGMSKILEYTMASASDINVTGKGSINYQVGKTAYNSSVGGKWNQSAQGSSIEAKVEDVTMQKPEFKSMLVSKKTDELNIENFDKLKNYVISNGKKIDKDASTGILDNGLGYCTIDGYTILFISRSKISIDKVNSLSNTIIVTDGEVYIKGESATFSKVTIYSPLMTVNVNANLHFAGAPLYDGSALDQNKNVPYLYIVNGVKALNNNIKEETLNKIDELFITYMTSFGADSDISGKPDISYEDVEYNF